MKPMKRRITAVILMGMLGLGAAACGTSSGAARTQNAPSNSSTGSTTPTTAATSSGGAGF